MNQVAVNTFEKGMNKDAAVSSQPPNSYIHAENIRINTENGTSQLAISNVNGTLALGSFPAAYPVYEIVPNSPATYGNDVFAINTTSGLIVVNITGFPTTAREYYDQVVEAISNHPTFVAMSGRVYREDLDRIVIWLDNFTHYITSISAAHAFANRLATRNSTFKLLGSTNLRDSIIIFTTSYVGEPGGDGQIWKVDIDPLTHTPTFNLMYHRDNLNFTTAHPVRRAVGNYETQKIQRVYWTDRYNPPRVINIGNADIMGYDVEHLLLQKLSNYNKPIIDQFHTASGRLLSGMYQYAYRLKSEGYVTKYSPLSDLIHVVKASETTGDYFNLTATNEYNGTTPGEETSKAISVRVDLPDEDYDTIEFLAFYRESVGGLPRVFQFAELPINNADYVTAIHTANEESFEEDYGDLISYGLIFDTVKDIAVKDGSMFFGNVKLSDTAKELTMNARAYRFKRGQNLGSPRITYLQLPGTTTQVQSTDAFWLQLGVDPNYPFEEASPHNRDAFNPYNLNDDDLSYPGHSTWLSKRYIYQSDGLTVGGEGPYVKYKFVSSIQDGCAYTAPTIATLNNVRHTSVSPVRVSNQGQPSSGTWNTFKSPIIHAMSKGYHPGEIYRFGLVLYDFYGRPGFVNWIGDIRFPEIYNNVSHAPASVSADSYLSLGNDFSLNGVDPYIYTRTMGVEFTVNIPPDLQDKISGYSIVRVKRDEHNRTRIGVGILNPVGGFENGNDLYLAMTDLLEPSTGSGANAQPYIHSFDCPDIQFNPGFQRKDGDRIRVVGTLGLSSNINTGNPIELMDPTYSTQELHKFVEYSAPTAFLNGSSTTPGSAVEPMMFGVDFAQKLAPGEVVQSGPVVSLAENVLYSNQNFTALANYTCIDGGVTVGPIVEANPTQTIAVVSTVDTFSGGGNDTLFIGLQYAAGNDELFGRNTKSFYANGISGDRLTSVMGTPDKVMVSYERTIANQYGGRNEEARSRNVYMRCSDFIPYVPAMGGFTFQVFGGDTYVDLYGNSKIEHNLEWGTGSYTFGAASDPIPEAPYWAANLFLPVDPVLYSYSHYQIFPATATFNFALRNGFHLINKDNGTTAYPNVVTDPELAFDQFLHEAIYSIEDDTVTFIPEPYNKVFQEEFDSRIYGSQSKILGEEVDSWSQYLPDTRLDVDAMYGPIEALMVHKDNLLFLQDDAFGMVAVNPEALAITDVGSGVNLGRGTLLHDYKYISTDSGTKHQLSVISTDTAMYFFDAKRHKLRAFKGQDVPLSDVKGMTNWFRENLTGEILTKDNWLKDRGVITAHDRFTNDVYFTFLDALPYEGGEQDDSLLDYNFNGWTLGFNELLDVFTSFYSFIPNLYLSNKKYLLSHNRGSTNLYAHGLGDMCQFYGNYYDSKLSITVSDKPANEKVYDNISYRMDGKQNGTYLIGTNFTDIRCHTTYQNTDYVTPNPNNSRRRFREWHYGIPRNVVNPAIINADIFDPANLLPSNTFKDRLRDFYITEDFIFTNSADIEFILHYIKTHYRVNFP